MNGPEGQAIAATAAKALRDSANRHKRASGFHRRAAKLDMEALRKFKDDCARLGITIRVESQGGNHG